MSPSPAAGPAADCTFDSTANNNTVDIAIPTADRRYIRVQGTANNRAPGLQVAEFEVHGN